MDAPQTPTTHSSPSTSPEQGHVTPSPFAPQPQPPPTSQMGPLPTSLTPPTAVPALYLDNLAREFGLGDRDRMKLRGFLQVCGNTGLRPGDLLGQLYMLAVVLSEAAERRRAAQENIFGGDLRAMMRDLQIRLDDSFSLTTTQKANVRGITQDVIHEATRTTFSAMHVDVLVILKDRKQYLDLDNIFGVPVREKKLMSALKRACSSVRNAYRQDIRDSIDPASFVPLDKITYTLASKYKLGGVGGELSDLFSIHAALLRRFAFDNPDLLWTDEADGEDDSESSHPPAKKRKTTAKQGGRIAAGADFWGKVDIHFKDQVALRGRNFKDARWKPYIDQILADDASKFAGIVPGAPVTSLPLEGSPGAPDSSFGGALAQYGTTTDYTTFAFTNGVGFDSGGVGAWGNSFNGIVGQS
ncbi:hypothetical protein R3P38DRAFT_3602654 [Favolaschia claudopus]|uniref:Uncharacterized protein n=1 Tax=Favolaschia claudopus TaxID=2862362 RepID=A0AAW0ABD2_9AGAR